jgi:hypothetical protein
LHRADFWQGKKEEKTKEDERENCPQTFVISTHNCQTLIILAHNY